MNETNYTYGNRQSLPLLQRFKYGKVESVIICEVKGDQLVTQALIKLSRLIYLSF